MNNLYVLKGPVISEKSLLLANQQNVYTFKVAASANKNQIKQAIELVYDVKVLSVNTIIRKSKSKRTGRKRLASAAGKTKYALIKLKPDQTIELFDIGGTN